MLKIKLGGDMASASSDRTLEAGEFVTKKMKVEVCGQTVCVADLELVNELRVMDQPIGKGVIPRQIGSSIANMHEQRYADDFREPVLRCFAPS